MKRTRKKKKSILDDITIESNTGNSDVINRRIVVGFILSGEYLATMQSFWNAIKVVEPQYKDTVVRTISDWCFDYFDEYDKPIGKSIDLRILKALKKKEFNRSSDDPETIEEEIEGILQTLEKTYHEKGEIDVPLLVNDSLEHFNELQLNILTDAVKKSNNVHDTKEALKAVKEFTPFEIETDEDLDYTIEKDKKRREESVERGDKNRKFVFGFKSKIGELINDELYRGAFVGVLAREKMGKSWFLLECLITAHNQGNNVIMFQAGDMTKDQQTTRIGTRLAQIPNKEEYLGEQYNTVLDCALNQIDKCDHKIREKGGGIISNSLEQLRNEPMHFDQLKELYDCNPQYKPCTYCSEFENKKWGVPWLKKKPYKELMTVEKANKVIDEKLLGSNTHFITSTFKNGTLTTALMEAKLRKYRKLGIIFDCIGLDYMDLVVSDKDNKDNRINIKSVWEGVRRISQEDNKGKSEPPLVIAPTQADAKSYKQRVLNMDNFSDSKTKNADITALIGLNQDPEGIENSLGIIRVNKVLSRENKFDPNKCISVVQDLKVGRPITRFNYW